MLSQLLHLYSIWGYEILFRLNSCMQNVLEISSCSYHSYIIFNSELWDS